jgi:hypothetical protein
MDLSTAAKKIRGMSRRLKIPIAKLGEGLHDIRVLVEAPNSPDAETVIEKTVARYNAQALDAIGAAGLIHHPHWAKWYRLIQVRFIQVVCKDRPSVADAVRLAFDGGDRPNPEKLMGVILRHCLMEQIGWARANKGKPLAEQIGRPKRVDIYWQEAFASVNEDMVRECGRGKTIQDAPKDWYSIFGKEYTIDAVPLF